MLGGQNVMYTKLGVMLASVVCSIPVGVASIAPCVIMYITPPSANMITKIMSRTNSCYTRYIRGSILSLLPFHILLTSAFSSAIV